MAFSFSLNNHAFLFLKEIYLIVCTISMNYVHFVYEITIFCESEDFLFCSLRSYHDLAIIILTKRKVRPGMKNKIPYIVLSAIFICLIALLFISVAIDKMTLKNDGTVLGNSAGNLYNGGLFCEFNDKIYFANHKDDNSLYRMNASDCSGIEKLHDDRICYLNADENYLFYSRMNHQREEGFASIFTFYNTGLYRLNRKNGRNLHCIYRNPCGLSLLYGNELFFQHYRDDQGLSLYKIATNGDNESKVSSEALLPANVTDGLLYYAGVNQDHYLHTLDPATGETTTILERNIYFPIVRDEGIYFMTLGDYAIHRYNPAENTSEKLISEPCSSYNISNDGRYLYYQIDRTDNNRICVLDLNTMTSTTILEGDFGQIHVTSNYVFFTDFAETEVYAYATDDSGSLNRFNPPVED